jgi:hypothetical protein
MDEEKFKFSGHPSYLEWYRCYDDLSIKEWLDGMELKQHKGTWDERAIAKWNFFYRPFKPVVGRPQQKMIRERQASICVCEAYIAECSANISQQKEQLRRSLSHVIAGLVFLGMITTWLLFKDSALFVVPIAIVVVVIKNYYKTRTEGLRRISELEESMKKYNSAIETSKREIGLLETEIRRLLEQIPQHADAINITNWLNEELAEMECVFLGEFLSKPVTRAEIGRYIPQNFGDPRISGLLIDSWGFLQPTSQKGPFGQEGTGLRRAKEDLKNHLATWQVSPDGNPVFRLLFLQYIFPLEKNLNICSLFYDFITRRCYGKRLETFQYNHITNYSIREVEPEEEPWIGESGLVSMNHLLQGKIPKALAIAVASGNHFRCVLVDEDIVDALNEWMTHEEKYKELEASMLKDSELETKFKGNKQLIATWKAAEKQRLEEDMRAVVREKQMILWKSGSTAKAILAHVRSCVEEYVLRFQAPA